MADAATPPSVNLAALARHLECDPAQVDVTEASDSFGRWRYLVRAAGAELELRRVREPHLPGTHTMAEEADLIAALRQVGIPAPTETARSEDPAVCGAPWLLTQSVPGHRLVRRLPVSYPRTSTTRHDISAALVDQLVALHSLDTAPWRVVDGDETATARDMAQWWETLGNMAGARLAVLEDLHHRLADSVPPLSGWALLHNSFHLGNLIYSASSPDTVVGVLNWEMAAPGDPLNDLGYLLACWPEDADDPAVLATGVSLTCDDGFFSRSTVTHEYTMRRGCNLQHLTWYIAYGYLRLALVTEARRLREGNPVPSRPEDDAVLQLTVRGLARLDGH